MTRDVESLRAEYRTLRAAADAACREAQAAQSAARDAYGQPHWQGLFDALALAMLRWQSLDDIADRARAAVVAAEDEAMGAA